jgi:hypothetical protein
MRRMISKGVAEKFYLTTQMTTRVSIMHQYTMGLYLQPTYIHVGQKHSVMTHHSFTVDIGENDSMTVWPMSDDGHSCHNACDQDLRSRTCGQYTRHELHWLGSELTIGGRNHDINGLIDNHPFKSSLSFDARWCLIYITKFYYSTMIMKNSCIWLNGSVGLA